MTLLESPPRHASLLAARRDHTEATVHLVAGIALSVAGIAVLVWLMLGMLPSLGSNPTVGQGIGVLLIAVVALAASDWGTDLRHASAKKRRIVRVIIERLEAERR